MEYQQGQVTIYNALAQEVWNDPPNGRYSSYVGRIISSKVVITKIKKTDIGRDLVHTRSFNISTINQTGGQAALIINN